jgi:hypothetical protein
MTQRHLLILLAASTLLWSGCILGQRKNRTKEGSEISAEVEESFQRRWVDQRVTQLTAQGVAAAEAGQQTAAGTPRQLCRLLLRSAATSRRA